MAALLPEDLVEEIFLRVPPNDPALLIRGALVCKAWRRILLSDDGDDGGGFHRRYVRFHKTPPLLGYIHNISYDVGPRFVATSSFSPRPRIAHSGSSAWALDCRHGRVLIHTPNQLRAPLLVWDPVTGSQERLSMPPAYTYPSCLSSWAAAVLCAVDGCDHIDCHGGGAGDSPFLVVFVEAHIQGGVAHQATCTYSYCASVYSSQTSSWSAPTPHISSSRCNRLEKGRPSLVIGDTLYFTLRRAVSILRYDLGKHRLSLVDTPTQGVCEVAPIPIETVDGELGFVAFSYLPTARIYMWSRRRHVDGAASGGATAAPWEQHRIVELDALLPDTVEQRQYVYPNEYPFDAIRFAEGTHSIFISIYIRGNEGVFVFDLKSRQLSKIGQRWVYSILPYRSFYTQDLAKGKNSPP